MITWTVKNKRYLKMVLLWVSDLNNAVIFKMHDSTLIPDIFASMSPKMYNNSF